MFCYKILREWRLEKRFTSKQMSKILDLSSTHYNNLERGLRQPSLKIIQKISEATGLSMNRLLYGEAKTTSLFIQEQQANIIEEQKKRLVLEQTIITQTIRFSNLNLIMGIKQQILDSTFDSLKSKCSIDTHREKLISIAQNLIQKQEISCELVCEAFGITMRTLKKWIGDEKLLFKCPFNLFPPVFEFNAEIAGQKFQCFNCEYARKQMCKGYGWKYATLNDDDIFAVIDNITRTGITDRKEQVKFLRDNYGLEITEGTLNVYLHKRKTGEYVPEDFRFMEKA